MKNIMINKTISKEWVSDTFTTIAMSFDYSNNEEGWDYISATQLNSVDKNIIPTE